jgi:hypothetical protein
MFNNYQFSVEHNSSQKSQLLIGVEQNVLDFNCQNNSSQTYHLLCFKVTRRWDAFWWVNSFVASPQLACKMFDLKRKIQIQSETSFARRKSRHPVTINHLEYLTLSNENDNKTFQYLRSYLLLFLKELNFNVLYVPGLSIVNLFRANEC